MDVYRVTNGINDAHTILTPLTNGTIASNLHTDPYSEAVAQPKRLRQNQTANNDALRKHFDCWDCCKSERPPRSLIPNGNKIVQYGVCIKLVCL